MRTARKAGVALVSLAMAGGLATAASGTASAADVCTYPGVAVYNKSGDWAGNALWNANPACGVTGDTLGAFDSTADGYGVIAYLSKLDGTPIRSVSTSGHSSPYTAWKSGNLPEDQAYYIWGCLTKGGAQSNCSKSIIVYS
ncbi:hypothetical protein SHKM778_17900 [Streptomyces sp. KM77-8]|uniref:Uncharacterized protein n=1 Tax=Streptomyces haneummycinicus TaxID=3074435 RepID=A0AAT9HD95_9ACTN